ncbi:MAG TPA: hypothetical protein VI790_01790 [Candidatus Nanoarchaeia archaeon]|nr:hypothetical protein [Candidatus Nanoarchaeia archaeon]
MYHQFKVIVIAKTTKTYNRLLEKLSSSDYLIGVSVIGLKNDYFRNSVWMVDQEKTRTNILSHYLQETRIGLIIKETTLKELTETLTKEKRFQYLFVDNYSKIKKEIKNKAEITIINLIDVPEIKEPITRNFETIKLEDLLTTINEKSERLRQEDVKKEIRETPKDVLNENPSLINSIVNNQINAASTIKLPANKRRI